MGAGKALASKTGEVKFLRKGEPGRDGEPGPMGPLVYPAGEYAASASYTRTSLSAPMVLCDGQYYVLNREGTFKGINPGTDYAANGGKASWVLMDKVRYSFIEVLMANFAKLASAVFYEEFMFSQQGTDASGNATSEYGGFGTEEFTPNLLIDFLRGTIKCNNVDIRGSVVTPYIRIELDPGVPAVCKFAGRTNAYIHCTGDAVDEHALYMPPASEMAAGTEVNLFSYAAPGRLAPKPKVMIYPDGKFLPDNVAEILMSDTSELQLKVVKIGADEGDKRWFAVNASR